jgi:hypothetical protein
MQRQFVLGDIEGLALVKHKEIGSHHAKRSYLKLFRLFRLFRLAASSSSSASFSS